MNQSGIFHKALHPGTNTCNTEKYIQDKWNTQKGLVFLKEAEEIIEIRYKLKDWVFFFLTFIKQKYNICRERCIPIVSV